MAVKKVKLKNMSGDELIPDVGIPSQTGNNGKVLGTNGSSLVWVTQQGGGATYTAGDGIDITNNVISVDAVASSEVTLATVATSGDYSDLSNKPTIPTTTDSVTQSSTAALTSGGAYIALADKQDVLTAGSNISISNNTISATDTTYSAFSGTDGETAGVAGLVPAPTSSDSGKYLKSDGTWATVSGGGGGTTYTAGDGIDITNNVISVDSVSTSEVMLATVATSGSYNDLTGTPSLNGYQITSNLVTSVSSQSTDSQYPSAKLFYDTVGNIETLLSQI